MNKKGLIEEYDPIERQLSNFMKALAHPARIAIMMRLAKKQDCTEGGTIEDMPIQDSSVQIHLRALEQAGLIKGSTTIHRSSYCINWDAFWFFTDNFTRHFNDFRVKAENQICNTKTKGGLLSILTALLTLN